MGFGGVVSVYSIGGVGGGGGGGLGEGVWGCCLSQHSDSDPSDSTTGVWTMTRRQGRGRLGGRGKGAPNFSGKSELIIPHIHTLYISTATCVEDLDHVHRMF